MIATLDDVIERIANMLGIYGAHGDVENDDCNCRVCFTSELRRDILAAVEIERKLGSL